MDIKAKLDELRKSMTLVDIAKAIGVNRATVVRAQRGDDVSLKTYIGVCDLLNMRNKRKTKRKPGRVEPVTICHRLPADDTEGGE